MEQLVMTYYVWKAKWVIRGAERLMSCWIQGCSVKRLYYRKFHRLGNYSLNLYSIPNRAMLIQCCSEGSQYRNNDGLIGMLSWKDLMWIQDQWESWIHMILWSLVCSNHAVIMTDKAFKNIRCRVSLSSVKYAMTDWLHNQNDIMNINFL